MPPRNRPETIESASAQPEPGPPPRHAAPYAERKHTGEDDHLDDPRVGNPDDGEYHQDRQRRDRDQQESALFHEDCPPLMPGQRAAQSDPRSERRTEDVAHESGQNRSHDDGCDVPEPQLLPTVVDDQHNSRVIVV